MSAGFGCSSSQQAQKGGERQPCLSDNTCNPGLTCLSDVCVNPNPNSSGSLGGSSGSIPEGSSSAQGGSVPTKGGAGAGGSSKPPSDGGTSAGRTGRTNTGAAGRIAGGNAGTNYVVSGPVASCSSAPITPAAAPNGQFTVPTAHPRLWWTPDRLTTARAWAKSHTIDFNPSDMEDTDYLLPALSYLLTGNQAHAKLAIDWALALKADPSSSQDQYRWYGEEAILIYDWCYNELTDSQRKTLRDRWNGYVKIGNQQNWGGPDMPESNYYWGYLRNSLEWGIATFGESDSAQSFIDDALVTRWKGTFLPFAAKDALGGVPPEGSQYGHYNIGYPLIPFMTAVLNGRAIYDETLFYKQAIYALIYDTPPTATTRGGSQTWDIFGYSDDEMWFQGDGARFADWGETMQTLADLWSKQRVGQYARQWVNQVGSKLGPYVSSVAVADVAASFDTLPLDYFAPGSGFFYLRNNWGPGATVTLLQLGYAMPPGNHQHLDCGSFQIWRSGRWLSRESVGYGDTIKGYNGGTAVPVDYGPGHNVILFNGAGPVISEMKGKVEVLRLESQARYAYAATNVTAGYRSSNTKNDNAKVASVIREYLYVRELDSLVTLDRLAASADQVEKAWLLHSETQPKLNASARHITLTNGDQVLEAQVLAPSSPTMRTVDEGNRDSYGQYRVELVDSSGSRESYFLTALTFGTTTSGVTATGTDTAEQFTVTLANAAGTPKSVQIVFKKGTTSSGGSIAFDQDAAIPLRTDVQPISLTDCGPVWGNP